MSISPSNYYRCSARACTRSSSSTYGYLEILGERASFSPMRVSPGNIPRTSLAARPFWSQRFTVQSRLSLLQARTNERAICLLAVPAVGTGPEPPFYNAAVDRPHDFRNILIRTQVRLKMQLTRQRQIMWPHATFSSPYRVGFNRLIRNLIGFGRWFIFNCVLDGLFLNKHRHLWQFKLTIHHECISRGWSWRKRHTLGILRKRVASSE